MRGLVGLLASVCGLSIGTASAATDLPRVVSINVCADQWLLTLADDEQILSLTNLSHDAAASYYLDKAMSFPTNKGGVEEVLSLQPDLVIAGDFSSRYTVDLLKASGLDVKTLPLAYSIEDMLSNLSLVAGWVQQPKRAEGLRLELNRRLDAIPEHQEPKPKAAIYDPNGYTVGKETMRGDMLDRSGWHNVALDKGIGSYGTLSLETLISLDPDVLIASPYSAGTWSRAQSLNAHPALDQTGVGSKVIEFPSAQTICGGPWSVDVVERLVAERVQRQP